MNTTGIIILLIVGIVAILTYYFIGCAKMFEKAGKPKWAAIVPIYNEITILQMVGLSPWLVIIEFIPFVNIVFGMYVLYRLSISFGKGGFFIVAIMLFALLVLPILGYGSAEYISPTGEPPATDLPELTDPQEGLI